MFYVMKMEIQLDTGKIILASMNTTSIYVCLRRDTMWFISEVGMWGWFMPSKQTGLPLFKSYDKDKVNN